jgi:hypothetical protein
MAKPTTRLTAKTKQPSTNDTRVSIDQQTAAFLKSGGKIQQIANGVSGQVFGGSRHISLAKKPTEPVIPGSVQDRSRKGNNDL